MESVLVIGSEGITLRCVCGGRHPGDRATDCASKTLSPATIAALRQPGQLRAVTTVFRCPRCGVVTRLCIDARGQILLQTPDHLPSLVM